MLVSTLFGGSALSRPKITFATAFLPELKYLDVNKFIPAILKLKDIVSHA